MRIRWTSVLLTALIVMPAYAGSERPAAASTLGPLISVTPEEFLKLPEAVRAIYVGGVLDGATYDYLRLQPARS